MGWCYVCVCCESGLSVLMAGPGICILCSVDSLVHPVFNPVVPYRYLLSNWNCMWQISQIHTCLRVVVGPGLVLTAPDFMCSITSHPAGPHGRLAQKTVIGSPLLGGGRCRHNLHRVCQTAVTAPPRVGGVVWSHTVCSCSTS